MGSRFVMMGVMAMFAAVPGRGAEPAAAAAAPMLPEVAVTTPTQPWAMQFDMPSKITGRTYRIQVRKPDAPAPAAGYPVILFTDGNVAFPIATIAGLFAEVEGRGQALVVGVGYPSNDLKALTIMRNRDLTPTQPPGGIQQYPGYPVMTPADFGGSELYYRFLMEELRPQLARMYSTDAGNHSLAGHSLGGLFTLGVLFHHPQAFRSYIAMSPAIWWDNRALLAGEPALARAMAAGTVAPRLLMTAGAQEEDMPAVLPPGTDRAAIAENFRINGIIGNARGLADRLALAGGGPGTEVRFETIAGLHHNTSMPGAITRAVNFAVSPTAP